MHSELRIIKEAWKQLDKANSWVEPALRSEGIDEELKERWDELFNDIQGAFHDWREDHE